MCLLANRSSTRSRVGLMWPLMLGSALAVVAFSSPIAATTPMDQSGAAAPLAPSPLVVARHGMVVSAERDASRVGVKILQEGGNAVDAAVAVAFALAVVHPDAGNLGGGGFMMVHLRAGKDVAIDFRETAPRASTRTMYLDRRGRVIVGASTVGYQCVAVPGTVAGLALAEARFGRLGFSKVIEPARRLAQNGFHISAFVADALADPDARKALSASPESLRVFRPAGRWYQRGDRMVRPDLARTLARLQRYGPSEFYSGGTARAIARDMRLHGGLITLADLQGYRAVLRKPVVGVYRGVRIVSMPPPSSGGVALIEMLNILRRYNLKSMGSGSPQAIHFLLEAMRRAFADRSRYLGDPAFTRVPVRQLTSLQYADERAKSILPDRATPSSEIGPGQPAGVTGERPETTHFCVVDGQGNAASCTYTLNGPFGSGITVPGTGVVLNDEMDDFTSSPGTPNMFGLIQGEANAIAPGKRPLSSMTPTLVLKGNRLFLVTGSPGGPTIINTVLEVIVNVTDFGMNPAVANASPRFHHQWLPDRVRLEPKGFSPETLAALKRMGYLFGPRSEIGDAETIEIDPKTGELLGASDPRGSGVAMGY